MIYAATIFLSSFLLFLVQPLIARLILPWFGGSAAVWTTCMLFFQVLLLAGYAYAHCAATRRLAAAHAGGRSTRCCSLAALATAADRARARLETARRRGAGDAHPAAARRERRPAVLPARRRPARCCRRGSRARGPGQNPYRLFAVSNLASLLALVGYPFVVEPYLGGAGAGGALVVAVRASSRCSAPAWPGRTPRRAVAATATARKRPRRRRGVPMCSGLRSRRPARCCCSRSPTTSRRTSRRSRCSGSCRSRSTC